MYREPFTVKGEKINHLKNFFPVQTSITSIFDPKKKRVLHQYSTIKLLDGRLGGEGKLGSLICLQNGIHVEFEISIQTIYVVELDRQNISLHKNQSRSNTCNNMIK